MSNDSQLPNNPGLVLWQQSLKLLQNNLAPNTGWLVMGVITGTVSCATSVVFMKGKKFISSYYNNCLNIATANLIYGIVMACIGLKRIIVTQTQWGEVSTPARCSWEIALLQFGMNSQTTQTLSLTIDRLIAVFAPVYYSHTYKHSKPILNIIMWLICIAIYGIRQKFGLNESQDLIPLCVVTYTITPLCQSIISWSYVVMLCVITSLNICIFLVTMWRPRAKAQQSNGSRDTKPKKHVGQAKLTKIMLLVVTSDVLIWLFSQVAFAPIAQALASISIQVALGPYSVIAPSLNAIVNFGFYLKFDDEFSRFVVCGRGATKVQTATTTVIQKF